jgi:phenylpyruvate tautomerase PptA (4-oxalocrotonate tautomerase family)
MNVIKKAIIVKELTAPEINEIIRPLDSPQKNTLIIMNQVREGDVAGGHRLIIEGEQEDVLDIIEVLAPYL